MGNGYSDIVKDMNLAGYIMRTLCRMGRGSSTCCSFNNPPWFMKTLSSVTSDDLELRVFRDQLRFHEAVGLESVELYVQ